MLRFPIGKAALLFLGLIAAVLMSSAIRASACPEQTQAVPVKRVLPSEWCIIPTALAVDFLNDSTTAPAAFTIPEGTIDADGLAVFAVYTLSPEPNCYANITWQYLPYGTNHRDGSNGRGRESGGRLWARSVTAPGSASLTGRFGFIHTSDIPRIYFEPNRRTAYDRTAYLYFTYRTRTPLQSFTTVFVLHVRGRNTTSRTNGTEPEVIASSIAPDTTPSARRMPERRNGSLDVQAQEDPLHIQPGSEMPQYAAFAPTSLAVDFLNDAIDVPAAFPIQEGSVGSHALAGFSIYAVGDDPRYYANVTSDYGNTLRGGHRPLFGALLARVIPGPGCGRAPGQLRYSATSDLPRLYFVPRQPCRHNRTVYLVFT